MILDPKKIDIKTDTIDLQTALDRLHNITMETYYEHERRWDNKHMSQFIESIMIQVPVMPVWVRIDKPGRYTVVDGVKRLRALQNFIEDDWRLSDLEFVTDLENKSYTELPHNIQRRISKAKVQIYYICPGTGIQEAENISRRLH